MLKFLFGSPQFQHNIEFHAAKSLAIFAFASLIFTACERRKERHDEFAEELKFERYIKIPSTVFLETDFAPRNIQIIDSFLIVSNLDKEAPLDIIDIRTKKILSSCLSRGALINEVTNVADILTTNDSNVFWIFDVTLQKLVKFDINKAISRNFDKPESSVQLTKNIVGTTHPIWSSDSTFYSTSFSINSCRFIEFDTNSSIRKKVGKLPEKNEESPNVNSKSILDYDATIYEAFLARHPYSNKVVVAYSLQDRLEIYENAQLRRTLVGVDKSPPIVMQTHRKGRTIPNHTADTKYNYVQLVSTPKHIYALYSGKNNFGTCGKLLRILNWDGKEEILAELDLATCSFTVQENGDDVLIYFIDHDKGSIRLSRLSLK